MAFRPRTKKKMQQAGMKFLQDERNGCISRDFQTTYITNFGLGKYDNEMYIAYWHGDITEDEFCAKRHEMTNRRRKSVVEESTAEEGFEALKTLLQAASIIMQKEGIEALKVDGVEIRLNQ